jgi:hypothetical protein
MKTAKSLPENSGELAAVGLSGESEYPLEPWETADFSSVEFCSSTTLPVAMSI